MWPLIAILVLLIPLLAIILDSNVGRALASRLERGRLSDSDSLQSERLGYLEGEVDRLNSEITRLTEESEFLHRLLTEGDSGDEPSGALPEGEGPD